jgi:uncharacterized protein (TIGR00299 family) protein
MPTIAYIDCPSGISGDMFLAACIDAGLPLDYLRQELEKIALTGYDIESSEIVKQHIAGRCFKVNIEKEIHHHRSWAHIRALIAKSGLSPRVKTVATQIFERLAVVEAAVHNVDVNDVHFHEVGAVDSIVDIVGAAIALSYLQISTLHASPVPLGRGQVETAHGWLPLPAPATLALLTDLPIYGTSQNVELVTPTGAAILATQVAHFGAIPPMVLKRIGYGGGSLDLPERPNLMRLMIGESEAQVCADQPQPLFSDNEPETHEPALVQHTHSG